MSVVGIFGSDWFLYSFIGLSFLSYFLRSVPVFKQIWKVLGAFWGILLVVLIYGNLTDRKK